MDGSGGRPVIADSYIKGRGPAYLLDARPKFALLVVFTCLFFTPVPVWYYSVCAAVLAGFSAFSFGMKRGLRPFKLIFPILVCTALLTPPFYRTGIPLLSIPGGPDILFTDGLWITARLLLRFSGITLSFFIFFSSTETGDFILALRSFGLPYRGALVLTMSLRYIPYMYRMYGNISDAHKLRASSGRGRGFRGRIAAVLPVLTSVLIQAVKSIPDLAMALDSKGFSKSCVRTSYLSLPPGRSILHHWFAAALLAAAVMLPAFIIADIIPL